jgi:hypothetical protein
VKADLGHRPNGWVWQGPDERGGYPSGSKRVSELKPPPRRPGIGAAPRSDESEPDGSDESDEAGASSRH